MDRLFTGLRWLEIALLAISFICISVNFAIVNRRTRLAAGTEKRTVVRFGKAAILTHWLHTIAFVFLTVTGALLFFNLLDANGKNDIRAVHIIAGIFFAIVPTIFLISNPRLTADFIKETFRWGKDDIAWVKSALSYYFGTSDEMPPQRRINGGQKLWQLIVVITAAVLLPTGLFLWFFKGRGETSLYLWASFTHALAFVVVSVMFTVHLYMSMLHPRTDESLSSMLDGKVSESYARQHYPLWFAETFKRKEPKAQSQDKTPAGVQPIIK
ncbi:MAG: cytochrome b/b6 domain-containing protein [Dehalococcoidales bacterium]|nr:cytochrome b/b6 domain-containing protein [Dehalococcoidales bacterium]